MSAATKVICNHSMHELAEHVQAKQHSLFTDLVTNGVLHEQVLALLWSSFDRSHHAALKALMVKFGLMVPLPQSFLQSSSTPSPSAKGDPGLPVFKVPALLPSGPLPDSGFQCASTFFFFFTVNPFGGHANSATMKEVGFLPDGLFSRVLGKCYRASLASILSGMVSILHLESAILGFGGDVFILSALPEINAIRVQVAHENPLVIVDTLRKIILASIEVKGGGRTTYDAHLPNN